MSLLTSILPAPSQRPLYEEEDDDDDLEKAFQETQSKKGPPPYGKRRTFIPRTEEDFGDGGAFPEIAVAQYPLGMGRKKSAGPGGNSGTVALSTDSQGRVQYDAVIKQGLGRDRVVHSRVDALVPADRVSQEEKGLLQRPDDDAVAATTAETKAALERIVQTKIAAAVPAKAAEKQGPAQYIRYTPAQQGEAFNSGAQQRIIRMVEMPKDPMEPPKFKNTKKVPKGPGSPPAPVMHSPPRKLTQKEQDDWKIPPCISNWKNPKGYTIPLDKRLCADGRGLQEVQINDNFAKLAEALQIADRKAREAVEARGQIQKALAQKEKERKEESLRELAARAREERAGIARPAQAAPPAVQGQGLSSVPSTGAVAMGGRGARDASEPSDESEEAGGDDARERDEIREERRRDRERERRMQRMAPDRRTKMDRNKDRDIGEAIALGLPAAGVGQTQEALYDTRLFNQNKGMDAGFGDEDSYNVYDKPLFNNKDPGIYRPKTNVDNEIYGDDVDAIVKRTDRFHADKGFQGADPAAAGQKRDGPVQFERVEEEDMFGLDKFLTDAKRGKRPLDAIGKGTLHAGASGAGSTEGRGDRKINFDKSSSRDDERSSKRSRHE
eukprot:Opistho-2@3281